MNAHYLLDHPFLVLLAIFFSYKVFSSQKRARSTAPLDVPWIGFPKGFFAGIRAKWNAIRNSESILSEAYNKYSKFGKHVVIPAAFSRPEVLLPPSYVPWIVSQSEKILGVNEIHGDMLQPTYAFLCSDIEHRPTHETIIRRDLTRQLGVLVDDVMEEIIAGFDRFWGNDTEDWKQVNVYDTVEQIIARTSNRVFIGLPLCRNDEYIANSASLSAKLIPVSQLIRLFPRWLQPVVGPIIALPNRIHRNRCFRYTLPLIKERLIGMTSPATDSKYTPPNDFITWSIQDAVRRKDLRDLDPQILATRLLVCNFVAIGTSTSILTNLIYDIYASDPSRGYREAIEEEAQRLLHQNHGKWTKSALGDMDGLHLSQGARIAVSTYGVHRDPEIYPRPYIYEPFRFSRQREEMLGQQQETEGNTIPTDTNTKAKIPGEKEKEGRAATLLAGKNLSAVTTSENFLPFGHAKHACPGRFFAANEIKLAFAYLSTKYDVKQLATRPKGMWIGEFNVVNMKTTMWIRRRKENR